MKILSLCEITGDKKSRFTALANIGSLHREMNNTDIAMQYLLKAKSVAEELGFQQYCVITYELGLIYFDQGKLDMALEYELDAIKSSRNGNYAPFECYSAEALSKIYLKKKDYRQAMYYADECLKIANELGDNKLQGDAWAVTSDIYLEQKHYKESEAMALKAWELDSVSLKNGHHIAYNIAMSNLFLGNQEKAAAFFEKYNDILKRYNDKNFHETFAGMEIQYETEKKEMRITTLEKEQELLTGLGIASVSILLLLLLTLIYRQRLVKQRVKQLEQEKQIIAAQSVLEGEIEERKRIAGELHDSLGAMLSVVKLNLSDVEHLQNARDLLDQSINELRSIAHRMMPESLVCYGLKTSLEDFSLSVPNMKFHYFGDESRLDNKIELFIYRCVHELVNNSIKYSGAENINVQLVQDADRVSLTVQDDGCGFDPKTSVQGMGLRNLQNRVTAYNGTINIYSSPDKGTEVYVDIPYLFY
jgi:signal transduction histidine kinase